MPIMVYSTPTCPWCRRAKEFLRERGAAYIEKDVSVDRQAAEEMIGRTHQMGVPVIADDHEAIVGFDIRRLESMVARNQGAAARLGLRVKDAPVNGAEVLMVHPDTAGARAGVRAGDVVLAVGERPVRNGADLAAAWQVGGARLLRVLREGQVLELPLQ